MKPILHVHLHVSNIIADSCTNTDFHMSQQKSRTLQQWVIFLKQRVAMYSITSNSAGNWHVCVQKTVACARNGYVNTTLYSAYQ